MRSPPCAVGSLMIASAILVGAAAGSAQAAASARLVYIRGAGAEECPRDYAVRAAVKARLGYDPFLTWAHDTLFVEIQRRGRAFQVLARLVDGDNVERGTRKLAVPAGDCTALIDALGLTISLTLDPSGSGGVREPQTPLPPLHAASAPEVPLLPVDAPVRLVAAPSVPVAPRAGAGVARRWLLEAALGLLGTMNEAPASTGGATLSLGAVFGRLSIELEGRASAPVTGASETPPARVRSWLLAGSLVPCLHVGPAFGCPVLAVGTLEATARNVATPSDQRGPWSAAGGRIGVERPVADALVVRAYLQALAVLTRDAFSIDGTKVYTVPAWSGAAGIAFAWRFR